MVNNKKDLRLTLFFFSVSAFLILLGVYGGIPFFMGRGLLFAESYLFCFHLGFLFLFIGAFVQYKREGHPWNWKSFAQRTRLKKFDKPTVKWLFIFIFLSYLGFFLAYLLGNVIAKQFPFLQPDFLPAELNVNKDFQWGYFFDLKLEGQWWFAILYTIGWMINILGEELLFRGILYPLHEKRFGKKAWIFHSVIWGLWHVYWMWNFIPILLFISVPLILATHKTKNTWVPIIIHGLLNFTQIVYIYIEVAK